MTAKRDYTEDEWKVLRRAPLIVGLAVSLADPGGPIELSKETMAALRSAAAPPSDDELLIAVSQDVQAQVSAHENPAKELGLHSSTARQQVVDDLAEVDRILAAKATPEEAASFRRWMVETAEKAAEAAKEGGFFGIGATRVSKGESEMLGEIRTIMGVDTA
jgi:hypothetical protein